MAQVLQANMWHDVSCTACTNVLKLSLVQQIGTWQPENHVTMYAILCQLTTQLTDVAVLVKFHADFSDSKAIHLVTAHVDGPMRSDELATYLNSPIQKQQKQLMHHCILFVSFQLVNDRRDY